MVFCGGVVDSVLWWVGWLMVFCGGWGGCWCFVVGGAVDGVMWWVGWLMVFCGGVVDSVLWWVG